MKQLIYGAADIAESLGVSTNLIGMWRKRYADTPPPQFRTPGGREFWSAEGAAEWVLWQERFTTGQRLTKPDNDDKVHTCNGSDSPDAASDPNPASTPSDATSTASATATTVGGTPTTGN